MAASFEMCFTATMTLATTVEQSDSGGKAEQPIHPLYVRVTHWVNALAVLIMIGSGWQIYNGSPLFPFTFPRGITLGGWLAGGILWHFAAMWLFVVNGLIYLILGFATGRFRRKLLPIRPLDVARDLSAAFAGRLSYRDPTRYNAVQRFLYAAILAIGIVIVLSGAAMWKPVQLWELTMLFGGYEGARLVHFFAMAAIALFFVVHVVMALAVPRSLRAMIKGR